ncbi:MAG: thrombospondin type 3 repeat-containing protein [Bacteroidota bacterium]
MQFHGDPLSRLKAKTGLYFGAKILDKIVPGARNVLPNSVREQIPQNFGDIFRVSATNNDFQELKWTFTETNTFRTSADPELTGSAGDLYVGHAMNMAYALTDIVEFDEETCAVDTLTDVIFAPESLETQFIYSEEFIRKSLIRDLEGQKQLFVRRYDQDTTQSGLIDSIAFFHTQAQLWRDVLAQNELLKQTTPTDRNITFDAGAGEFENKVRIDTVRNFTLKFLLNLDKSIVDERSMSSFLTVGPPVPPGSPVQSGTTVSRGIKLTNQYSISATIGSSSNLTERFTQETGYVLNDDDADGRKDFFSVDIGKDQKFGTPVFSLVLGRSSCPYEAGTQPRDQARLRAEATTLTNVTEDFAEFSLFLDNISQSDERRSYVLEALNEFNTEAAAIEIGGIRQIEEVYELAPRQGLPVKVRLYRSGNACSYPDIPFVLRAECGNDGAAVTPAGNTIVLSDTILLSAFFNCNCGSANLDLPEDNWRLNGTDGDRLLVKLSGYNPALIQRIDLQYTERETSAWREGPRWTGEDLANAPVSLTDNWVLPTDIADGAYSLRLRILCNEDGYSYSEVRHGTIDRIEPLLSGYPEPADEILEAGDRIAARFNEPIDCDLLGESPVTLTDQQGNVIAENVSIGCQGNTVILAADAALSRLGDTLTASMKNVSDLAGNVKREPVNWRFVVLAEENESDPDLDQIVSSSDNCPLTANADQRDRDGDGIGDACDDDRDGDGIPNASDTCPNIANPDQSPICETSEDPDEDGIPDAEDNCPDLANATQQDLDNDGIGDICDDDRDGDGIPNALDGCPDLNDPTNPASTQCTVSADEQRINDPLPRLKIFPNPATDEVSVRLPVGASFRTLQIFDATGRRVRSLPLPAVITAPFTCDLVGLPSGTYRLQAVGREVSVNGSLIVVPRQ